MTIHSLGAAPSNTIPNAAGVLSGHGALSHAELTYFLSRLFSISMAGGCLGSASLAAYGVITVCTGLCFGIPCAVAAIGSGCYRTYFSGINKSFHELEEIRRKAKLMSLDQVLEVYGWEDVLRLGVLTPDLFAAKYRDKVRNRPLLEMMEIYEKTMGRLRACRPFSSEFRVPHPKEFSRRWRQETASLTFEQIIEKYPLDKLKQYGIPESREQNCLASLKREYQEIKTHCDPRSFRSAAKDFNGRYLAHLSISGAVR